MKKTIAKKLSLDLQTVRRLDDQQLGEVNGGIVSTDTPSWCLSCERGELPTRKQQTEPGDGRDWTSLLRLGGALGR